ncbi:MAG: 3'-5' exonuclease [Clostridia bacterium]|nr:3'-5' exonuclease [Clostridia bacterium]
MKNISEQIFMVIDFETVTPKGVPPEPIQLGLVQIEKLEVVSQKQKSWFIKPPAFAPLTSFDTAQTGITNKDLENAKSSLEIFDILDKICSLHDYIFIAQNANYEFSICRRFYENRENLSKVKFIDTIKLAKLVFPKEKTYKLDHLAALLDIDISAGRHTALVDCRITGEVFNKLVGKLDFVDIETLLAKTCINCDKYKQISLF